MWVDVAKHRFDLLLFWSLDRLTREGTYKTLTYLRRLTDSGVKFKSYTEQFIPPVLFAQQYLGNLIENVRLFMARDFHMDSGMQYLIRSFYGSILENTPVPIPYREILLTARIMDCIFRRLGSSASPAPMDGQAQPQQVTS